MGVIQKKKGLDHRACLPSSSLQNGCLGLAFIRGLKTTYPCFHNHTREQRRRCYAQTKPFVLKTFFVCGISADL